VHTRTVRDEILPAKAAFADADLLVRMLAARLEAKHLGLALIGSAAVIGLAKTEGLIPAARPLLDQMVAAGYFIGPSVVSAVLCELGE
jgi:predicted nucleic acid-binding protein